ncbi:MAG: hypothetical protein KF802_08055 [Bdellovibrionaceae bacterium]|nr:hypothetical protein [Pseudobdellovibrionaceae bacterium]MBX3034546.1 hypothetical protein [Pseudobdellovibrionaceae bacterium]
MRSLLSCLPVILLLSLPMQSSRANEGGGEKKEEAKKEEAKSVPEWVELQSRLQTLKARIAGKEKTMQELIQAKQHAKDPAQLNQIVKDLKREHHEFQEMAEEYERSRNVLRYRYPEKGLKDGRTYERVNVRSLDDMENQVGLEGSLRRTIGKIRRQYADPDQPPAEVREKALSPARKKNEESRTVTEPSVMAK